MQSNKRIKVAVTLLLVLMAICAFSFSAPAAEDDAIKLTIIHTNDLHGRTAAQPYIAQMAKDLQASGENVLIFNAGDTLHGQTPANLSKGEAMVGIMNAVGYSAMTPGNHDFNFGVERLQELAAEMDFPLLAANVKDANGVNLFEAYAVIELNGLTVGVFGLATPETTTKSDPRIVAGLTFANPAETAADMVKALQEADCDIIIALTHLGDDKATKDNNKSDAVAAVPGIDLIIDGHSHTLLENGKMIGDTLVAQTGEFGQNIGVVELTLAEGAVSKTARLVAVPGAEEESTLIPDQAVLAQIAAEEAKIEPITAAVVGKTPVLLQGERAIVRTSETNLTNLITDSMRHATGADIAFLTGGNIRASIEAGDITMGQVLTTLPFANLLVTVELKGSDIMTVLEHGVSYYPEAAGAHIQVSGLSFSFDAAAQPGQRVGAVTMADGSTLALEQVYTVATIEFIAVGGDGYEMLTKGDNFVYYQGDADALAEYLATDPLIQAGPEHRITVLKAEKAAEPASTPVLTPMPAPVIAPAPALQPAASGETRYYTVQPGDYLSKIAEEYHTTWQELQKLNKIKNPNLIYPGQQLILPQTQKEAA